MSQDEPNPRTDKVGTEGSDPGQASPGDAPAEGASRLEEADGALPAPHPSSDSGQTTDEAAEPGAGEPSSEAAHADGDSASKTATAPRKETWTNTLLWLAGILVVLGIELYIYGHDGYIQVCVGIDQITKFEIRHEVKTKANAKYHPFCAERLNLGMWGSSDEHAKAALEQACHAAARVVGMERKQNCLRNDEPWKRFVVTEQVMPWDPRLYRRLLWLE